MSATEELLSPVHTATLVAPIIDRLRFAISGRVRATTASLAAEAGLGELGTRAWTTLRNTLPDRTVTLDHIRAVYRYHPEERLQASLAEAVTAGVLEADADGYRFTPDGHKLATRLLEATDAAARDLWPTRPDRIAGLSALAARLMDAAAATAGPGYLMVTPPYLPDGVSAAYVLVERITALRWYRFDAHVGAWEAAGFTPETIRAITDGPERDAVEAETNRRGAPPYAAIEPGERLAFIAGLGALTG